MGALASNEFEAASLDEDVYSSLVHSLFRSFTSLAAGAVGGTTAVLLTAVRTGDRALYAVALAVALVGAARVALAVVYRRRAVNPSARLDPRFWDRAYDVGATAFASLLGLWCLVGIGTSQDKFVHLVCASVTIGYAAGISARNAGRPQLVVRQILCTCVPLTLALLMHPDPFYAGLAALLGFFFWSMKSVSVSLSHTLLTALVARKRMASLADQLDAALSNMSHGVLMLDDKRRVSVCNDRFRELFRLRTDEAEPGTAFRRLLVASVRAGVIPVADARALRPIWNGSAGRERRGLLTLSTRDGRTLALTVKDAPNGGTVVVAEDTTEREEAQARIAYMAHYDDVTGLPNRAAFHDHLKRALAGVTRHRGGFAVMCIDLDRFKEVNDTLGHPVGDRLLREVAGRLSGLLRETDVLARFGGDEFVLLASPVSAPEEAGAIASRILGGLRSPFEISGHGVMTAASIGVALAPSDGEDADTLIKNADLALYRVKASGRGAWCLFEPEMDARAQARRLMELELRAAFASNGFALQYQPLVNLKTKRISTCEALLRWPHPLRGFVAPAEFIPVAEETGLIVDIGEWVLTRACTDALSFPEDVRVAVNVSAIQFQRSDLVASIGRALEATGLAPSRLDIEITESVLLDGTERTRAILLQLRELGVRITLDDFGTGYSSLSYLQQHPFQKVKIDRAFVRGLPEDTRALTMLKGVVRLSSDLGLSVTVEGVETEEQLAAIVSVGGIDELQGYLVSRPVDLERLRNCFTPQRLERAA